ncbi:MAG: ribF [Haloplasmataceae bacterium]|jgi:riboflavin kinase/FMN adenylyltransferase|nr:ribF [Haloplasmataceae bacterium]
MKVVYLKNESSILPVKSGLALALGFFDGLHLAHQNLIDQAIKIAINSKCKSGVFTFNPSPKQFLGKTSIDSMLTPHNMKIELLNKMGVDYLFVLQFDELVANVEHKEFVEKFILPLNVTHLITGFDYRYGYKGEGNAQTLVKDGNDTFELTIVEQIKLNDEKISSSKIREFILNGKVFEAKDLLGRFYTTEGIVIHGFKRGREIGFPTANISTIDNYLIPQNGVYIVKVNIFQDEYYGMCNIGYNPTFSQNNNKTIEVNIINFNKDIYNEKITVNWIKKIRDEKKFNGVLELIAQLNEDKQKVFEYIKNN